MSAIMKKFGGNVSIRGTLRALRIEIIDTEMTTVGARVPRNQPRKMMPPGGKGKERMTSHFCIDAGQDIPAFFCDTFDVRLSMKDVVDFEMDRDPTEREGGAGGGVVGQEFVDEDRVSEERRKSWHTLKVALNQIEARPATTKVCKQHLSHGLNN